MATNKSPKDPSDKFFDSLVSNAIDFLSRSIADLKKHPKYSVINFCVGFEIFLKARLIKEHWALVVTKPETAMVEQFRAGNFHSVSMEDAIRRLKNVAGERIGKTRKSPLNKCGSIGTDWSTSFIPFMLTSLMRSLFSKL